MREAKGWSNNNKEFEVSVLHNDLRQILFCNS